MSREGKFIWVPARGGGEESCYRSASGTLYRPSHSSADLVVCPVCGAVLTTNLTRSINLHESWHLELERRIPGGLHEPMEYPEARGDFQEELEQA